CNAARHEEGDDNARQRHMADGIADETLAPQQEEIADERAGHSGENSRQHRNEAQRNELVHDVASASAFRPALPVICARRSARLSRAARQLAAMTPRAGAKSRDRIMQMN